MQKHFLLGVTFALLCSSVVGQSSGFTFDSVSLKVENEPQWIYDHPFIAWDGHKFHYLDDRTNKVRVYDSSGKFLKSLGAKTAYEKKRANSCKRASSLIVLDTMVGIVYSGGVVFYNDSNEYVHGLNFWSQQGKQRAYGFNHLETGSKKVYHDQEERLFFLPLMKRRSTSDRTDTSYYFNGGLVGMLRPDSSEKRFYLSKAFAKRDSVYKDKLLPYLLDAGLHSHPPQKEVYVWQEGSRRIRVYNYSGELLRTFGEKAEHPGHHEKFISATEKDIKRYHRDFFLQGEKKKNYKPRIYRLQTIQYRDVHLAKDLDLVLRTYRPGVSTKSIPEKLDEDKYEEMKKVCESPLECGPGPDPMMKYLLVQEYKKPTALQIYNKKGEMIVDELIANNHPLSIIAVKDGMAYLKGRYDHSQKQYWVYKLNLKQLVSKGE